MENFDVWFELIKQGPVVIVMSIGFYFMYKYFNNQIERKDIIIKEKDDKISELTETHSKEIREINDVIRSLQSETIIALEGFNKAFEFDEKSENIKAERIFKDLEEIKNQLKSK